jgi:hypothetical protein
MRCHIGPAHRQICAEARIVQICRMSDDSVSNTARGLLSLEIPPGRAVPPSQSLPVVHDKAVAVGDGGRLSKADGLYYNARTMHHVIGGGPPSQPRRGLPVGGPWRAAGRGRARAGGYSHSGDGGIVHFTRRRPFHAHQRAASVSACHAIRTHGGAARLRHLSAMAGRIRERLRADVPPCRRVMLRTALVRGSAARLQGWRARRRWPACAGRARRPGSVRVGRQRRRRRRWVPRAHTRHYAACASI